MLYWIWGAINYEIKILGKECHERFGSILGFCVIWIRIKSRIVAYWQGWFLGFILIEKDLGFMFMEIGFENVTKNICFTFYNKFWQVS